MSIQSGFPCCSFNFFDIFFLLKLSSFHLKSLLFAQVWDIDMALASVKLNGGQLDYSHFSRDRSVVATFKSPEEADYALQQARENSSNQWSVDYYSRK